MLMALCFQRVGRAALYTMRAIFPPPETSGHRGGKDLINQKKLEAKQRCSMGSGDDHFGVCD
jgi:hypothetical protein